MARRESDREDLMAEATALIRRAEFDVHGLSMTVVAGYRPDGGLSFYFGPDPCYHFDAHLRLRRAFAEGDLYRTQGETLTRLRRVRTEHEVELIRHDLLDAERNAFCQTLTTRLQQFRAALDSGAPCLREVPQGTDLRSQLIESIDQLLLRPIALAPAIRGRR